MDTLTLQQLTKLLSTPSQRLIPQKNIFLRKTFAAGAFIIADLSLLALSMLIAVFLRNLIMPGEVAIVQYFKVMAVVAPLFPLAFYFRNLYPGFGVDVIEELRSLTFGSTIVFAVLAAMTFFIKDAWDYSRLAFFLSWACSLVMLPLGRAAVRKMFCEKSWWGIPVIVIGAGSAGEKVISSLQKHKQVGLRPVVAVDDDIDRWGYIHKIPVVGGLSIIPELAQKLKIDHAIVAMPKVPRERLQSIIRNYSKFFSSTTIIPDLFGLSSLWVSTRDLGGILGLEVQQKLLNTSSQFQKRLFDIFFASLLILFTLPLMALASVMIYIDSRGKVFFRQVRMGYNDTRFKILKFRTMHIDAEKRLDALLSQNAELKREYEIYHKMRNDPRLTQVGKILRKFSIDELPQFWNVIKGEMSLIGPRAYMPWEKFKMNGNEEIILQVKPGISGLWQVTDRNTSSFEERNLIDVYYIRNWSMFLDFYIVAKTIAVVITGKGGY